MPFQQVVYGRESNLRPFRYPLTFFSLTFNPVKSGISAQSNEYMQVFTRHNLSSMIKKILFNNILTPKK
jgi:hypothetical protein